jgi:hypothetical protein
VFPFFSCTEDSRIAIKITYKPHDRSEKMKYDLKYGRDREQRALNMYNNIPPLGEKLPRIRNYKGHVFNNRCVYVTDRINDQVFCKSQHWFKTNKIYTINIKNNRTVSCTCQDTYKVAVKCKHRLCVELNYQELKPHTYNLRYY